MECSETKHKITNMEEKISQKSVNFSVSEVVQDSKSPPHRKTSFARSMSVPNNSANSPTIYPKPEEVIPSVTISDFSSHELTSIHKGLSRHNSLPKTINKVRFCCPTHSRQKPSLSPALSMSDLSNHEEFSDAEPETP